MSEVEMTSNFFPSPKLEERALQFLQCIKPEAEICNAQLVCAHGIF